MVGQNMAGRVQVRAGKQQTALVAALRKVYTTLRDSEPVDVADRYDVHRDTVNRGVRRGDPLYPDAVLLRNGCKPRLMVTREA